MKKEGMLKFNEEIKQKLEQKKPEEKEEEKKNLPNKNQEKNLGKKKIELPELKIPDFLKNELKLPQNNNNKNNETMPENQGNNNKSSIIPEISTGEAKDKKPADKIAGDKKLIDFNKINPKSLKNPAEIAKLSEDIVINLKF